MPAPFRMRRGASRSAIPSLSTIAEEEEGQRSRKRRRRGGGTQEVRDRNDEISLGCYGTNLMLGLLKS